MERQRTSTAASHTNRVAEHLREGYDSATECLSEHPGTSVLVAFGVGFGMGMLLGHLLASPPREERAHHLAAIGRHVLETMGQYMPENLAKRFGS